MGDPSSQVITGWVKQGFVAPEWMLLKDACFNVMKGKLVGRSDAEIWEIVESNLEHVAEDLRNDLSECNIDGTSPLFEIDDEPSPYIRRVASPTSDILLRIRRVDPFDLEELCAQILAELGAESYTTQRTNDGGVDFIGINLSIVPASLPVPVACKAMVIGQAKRYQSGNTISEKQLREFVGAATLQRHHLQAERKLGPLAPILFAFWTTSDFDTNAKRFAREVGLWYMPGETLADYISRLGLKGLALALPSPTGGNQ